MFKPGLFKNIFQKVDEIFTGRGRIDEELFEELEEALIAADLNVHTTLRLMEELRSAVKDERIKDGEDIIARLKSFLTGILLSGEPVKINTTPLSTPLSLEGRGAGGEGLPQGPAASTVESPRPSKLSGFFSSLFRKQAAETTSTAEPGPEIVDEPVVDDVATPSRAGAPFSDGTPFALSGALNASPTAPTVILVVGVNGVGKTTSIAKLAYGLKQEGKKVLLGAADTFRAAAVDQLALWGERLGVDVIKGREGADPASVVFDCVQAAKSRGVDYLIVDTAGRLHNKSNLMEELKKINRVIMRALDGRSADETLLVLDATTGQNAISQAKQFKDAVDVTGLILAKLDGTARGGIVITIKDELGIPIKLIGTGEKPANMEPFDAQAFVDALFA